MFERSKHQVALLGSEVNRDSVKLIETPLGLTDADLSTMTAEVDSKMANVKAEV